MTSAQIAVHYSTSFIKEVLDSKILWNNIDYFVLMTCTSGGNSILASTIIPKDTIILGSGHTYETIYAGEPGTYKSYVYFTYENSNYYYYTRCANSTYGTVILRVYYRTFI